MVPPSEMRAELVARGPYEVHLSAYNVCSYTCRAACMHNDTRMHILEVVFDVYEDFIHYKSGVYQKRPDTDTYKNKMIGGHGVKVVGYGVENSVPYWLVQNSWTTTWGDGGFFKIRRGVPDGGECGIESGAVAGTF